MSGFRVTGFDHIVLCVRDVAATRAFYERVLGMASRAERPGKYSLQFGANKISLQDAATSPTIARNTVPGSGNFCLLSDTPVAEWRAHLAAHGVEIIDAGRRDGAAGTIDSLYFNDPDGNLVEVSNIVEPR
ncbi:VOC family protein [Sphingopyxis sp.]|jgi:catechol 2,3-dioxygenase-like lactoylglutathione lyase family enzyme|uniref:VOC family protein n=1 Tax=Sphingopyxis sp. TaxID=1908224 RepID=UPI002E0B5439|nr:VOC family protein [Sphingopyxis sp.]